jgi:tetratricopeptide (TPR) repeat protein
LNETASRLAQVRRLIRQRAYPEALGILTQALEREPGDPDVLGHLAGIHALLRQPEQAKPYLDRLLQVLPDSGEAHANAARNALAMNDVALAIALGSKAVGLAPEDAPARLTLADALEAGGRFEEAKSQYDAVLERDPRNVTALANLLGHREWQVSESHERAARALLADDALGEAQRVQLHFGLAHYHDARRQFDEAFTHLQAANAARHRWYPFDSGRFSDVVDELVRVLSKEGLRSFPKPALRSDRPIVIVGMPRSGTTLVEQVLASHSRIAAGGELPTLTRIATEIARAPGGYPRGLFALDADTLGRHAGRYLDTLAGLSADALRVTDKMPFNFLHLGLVAALLPDAKIVHCRRDAMDTCVSCHFTPFNANLQFASDLRALGRYYLDYRRLMDHWQAVLATPILEIDYERLVTDTEPTIRRLLAHCGVDWEPGCAQFHRTERGIQTPSRWQVRQPVYRHAIGRWRNYEKHLGPLLELVGR